MGTIDNLPGLFVMGNVISISLIMVVRGARKRLRMVSLYLDNMAQKQSWPAQAWLLPNSLGTSAKVSHPQSQDRSFERTLYISFLVASWIDIFIFWAVSFIAFA